MSSTLHPASKPWTERRNGRTVRPEAGCNQSWSVPHKALPGNVATAQVNKWEDARMRKSGERSVGTIVAGALVAHQLVRDEAQLAVDAGQELRARFAVDVEGFEEPVVGVVGHEGESG